MMLLPITFKSQFIEFDSSNTIQSLYLNNLINHISLFFILKHKAILKTSYICVYFLSMFFLVQNFVKMWKIEIKRKYSHFIWIFCQISKMNLLVTFGLWFSYSNIFLTSFFQSSIFLKYFLSVKNLSPINFKFLLGCQPMMQNQKNERNISLVHNIVVHVNGLGTLCVSANLFKFILCHVKQCKCKCKNKSFIWFYIVVQNKYTYMVFNVKQCKKCDLYWGGIP